MNAETIRHFVDTNVLIYAYDVSAGIKHQRAKELLSSLWEDENGCLSVQVLQEFYVVATKKMTRPLSPQMASQIITDLSVWRIHAPQVHDVINAIDLQQRYQLSFWDAMIVNSALTLDCAILWSEDLNHLQTYQQVRVQNPFK